MNEPTEEQIKEFLEHFGFKFKDDKTYDALGKEWAVHYPDGEWHHAYKKDIGKLIDPNNLFKWAVPKACLGWIKFHPLGGECHVTANGKSYEGLSGDPALALFWAIWKVIKENG